MPMWFSVALNLFIFWLYSRRISFTFCRTTCSLIWSTSPISSCMETAFVPFLRMCSEVWSTWTASFSTTIASGRLTAGPSEILAAWPSFTSSTTLWLSCQVRPWKTPRASSSSASTITPGPAAARPFPSGSGSGTPASPPLSSCALLQPSDVARISDFSGSWTLPSALYLTPALWLEPPPPPSAPRPAGGSPRTSLHRHPRPRTRRAQSRWNPSHSPLSSLSIFPKPPLNPSHPSMNSPSMRLPSPRWTKKNTGATMVTKTPPSAATSSSALPTTTTHPSPHPPLYPSLHPSSPSSPSP